MRTVSQALKRRTIITSMLLRSCPLSNLTLTLDEASSEIVRAATLMSFTLFSTLQRKLRAHLWRPETSGSWLRHIKGKARWIRRAPLWYSTVTYAVYEGMSAALELNMLVLYGLGAMGISDDA